MSSSTIDGLLPETTLELPNRRSTIRLARRLAPHLAPADALILSGGLGAGKTFFTRALLRAAGLDSAHEVTSPTFTLVHEYTLSVPIWHADAYRLGSEEELLALGLRDARARGAILIVEWGEPYLAALGGQALVLRFEARGDSLSGRFVTAFGIGKRGLELARVLAPARA